MPTKTQHRHPNRHPVRAGKTSGFDRLTSTAAPSPRWVPADLHEEWQGLNLQQREHVLDLAHSMSSRSPELTPKVVRAQIAAYRDRAPVLVTTGWVVACYGCGQERDAAPHRPSARFCVRCSARRPARSQGHARSERN